MAVKLSKQCVYVVSKIVFSNGSEQFFIIE
jgi:hypothetical protein